MEKDTIPVLGVSIRCAKFAPLPPYFSFTSSYQHTYSNLLGCGRMDTLAPCLQGMGQAL